MLNTVVAKTLTAAISRSSIIEPKHIKKAILVYNGKKISTVLIEKSFLGKKVGSFSLTKKLGKSIHNSERNRKKKAKNGKKK